MAKDCLGNDLAVGDRVSLIGTVKSVAADGTVVVVPHVCGTKQRTEAQAAIDAWKKDAEGRTAEWVAANPCPRIPVETSQVTISDAGLLEKHV